jgi:DNA-binding cell septation regulator SpoVG
MVTISDIKVWPVKKENKWVMANLQFTVDNAFVLKATLMKSEKGPWLSYPGKTSDKIDEKTKKKIFYADIKCIDKDLGKKIFEDVMKAYNKETGASTGASDQTPPPENLDQSTNDGIPF